MRLTTTLLLVLGCATARTDERSTTPTAPAPVEQRETAETAEVKQLAAELETSLANPPPAAPEPTPPEPFWAGYMVVQTNSVPPAVAVLFADDGIITDSTLESGIPLRAARANSNDGYWLFPVTRGALLFTAVRVYDDGHAVVEMPLPTQYGYATVVVAAYTLEDPSGASEFTPCVHGVCGRLQKAVANHIVGCEGQGCADLAQPTP